ncbi:MAG: hypothetical protein M1817_001243 [Caeruleum heppii]|nr:MAG: hypothetical protein M1817_001243 [Caeruleum heppii]
MTSGGVNGRVAPVASGTDTSLIDASAIKFTAKEKKGGTIKLKRAPPKQSKAGNWREADVVGEGKKDADNHAPSSPIVNELPDKDVVNFINGQTLGDEPDVVICKTCKKAVLKAAAAQHIKACQKIKNDRIKKKKEAKEAAAREKDAKERGEKDAEMKDSARKDAKAGSAAAEDADGEKTRTAKKSIVLGEHKGGDDAGGKQKGKKRKAEADAEKAPKMKKKKEEPKPKAAKPKGPVDVEKQCGVPLPNGAQCARSLTCKSHSMGSKRAVPGRSLPYDMLLNAYQKKNQAKQQKAAIDANAPLADDLDPAAGSIDSDEEKDLLMAAIARSRPQPLERTVFVETRKKYQYVRMKQMLVNALGGRSGGGLFSVGDGGGGAGSGSGRGLFGTTSHQPPGQASGVPSADNDIDAVGEDTAMLDTPLLSAPPDSATHFGDLSRRSSMTHQNVGQPRA